MTDPSHLANGMTVHVITSPIRRSDMIAQRSARTLLGRGVIQIIDRLVVPDSSAAKALPSERTKASPQSVSGLVELAIERGVPIFNDDKPEACAAMYEVTITAIIDLASDAVGNDAVERLRLALAEGQVEKDTTKRAWIFRRAMDRVYQDASRQVCVERQGAATSSAPVPSSRNSR